MKKNKKYDFGRYGVWSDETIREQAEPYFSYGILSGYQIPLIEKAIGNDDKKFDSELSKKRKFRSYIDFKEALSFIEDRKDFIKDKQSYYNVMSDLLVEVKNEERKD